MTLVKYIGYYSIVVWSYLKKACALAIRVRYVVIARHVLLRLQAVILLSMKYLMRFKKILTYVVRSESMFYLSLLRLRWLKVCNHLDAYIMFISQCTDYLLV